MCRWCGARRSACADRRWCHPPFCSTGVPFPSGLRPAYYIPRHVIIHVFEKYRRRGGHGVCVVLTSRSNAGMRTDDRMVVLPRSRCPARVIYSVSTAAQAVGT